MEKNLVTFLENKGYEFNSIEICLNGNAFDAEYIENEYDIKAFYETLKISKVYKENGNYLIDINNSKEEILIGFSPESFIPKQKEINKMYQIYLNSKD